MKAALFFKNLPKVRSLLWWGGALTLFSLGATLALYYHFRKVTSDAIFTDVNRLKATRVALVLGTSKKVKGGYENEFFSNRIEAAVELYQSGKVDKILVSGDNSSIYYNEPLDMKRSLMSRGVPETAIVMDCAGLRTLDSIIRAKKIFGQNNLIIVSQRFHLERAIYIARVQGIEAQGYVALDAHFRRWNIRVKTRELVSRVACILDCHVFSTQPKYMGKKEFIG